MSDQETCPICTRSVYSPYRVYDEYGKVIQGCVDASHAEHLVMGESSRWHHRKEAKQIRKGLADARKGR